MKKLYLRIELHNRRFNVMKKFLTSKWALALVAICSVAYAKLTGNMEALMLLPFIGTVDTAPGHPDYTQDGTNKNIPWVFSRKTLVKFYDSAVVAQVTNTDYEGDIKAMGDKVVITTLPDVTISKYKKGQKVSWEDLESPAIEMNIDRATVFAFKMDKVNQKQFTNKNYMGELAQDAAEQQKIFTDTEFLLNVGGTSGTNSLAASANKGATAGRKSSGYNLGTTGAPIQLTKTNILDKILELTGVANEQNWPISDRWLVLPSIFVVLLKQSDIKDASMTGDASSTIRTGRIGMIDDWNIYSTNLYTAQSSVNYTCLFGHKSAIAFAMQLTETEYFDKLETTFGQGMKGLQVYDWKVVKNTSLGCLFAKKG